MKVDLIRKFKWYIVGFMLVVIMLAVGLSFCAWDNLSITALTAQANTGGFNARMYKLGTNVGDDIDGDGIADVGDVVTFGRYYQDAPTINGGETILPEKTSLRWVVVEKQGEMLTLLTESVISFGSFWGTYSYDANNKGGWRSPDVSQSYYQNYERSTARAWLNSYSNLRSDGGTNFTEDGSGVFKGFYNIAFNNSEQDYIIAQDITDMRGSIKGIGELDKMDYNPIYGDKVWLPSYSQLFGEDIPYFTDTKCSDGVQSPIPNSKFSYFADDASRIGKVTAFAATPSGNYTYLGKTPGTSNYQYLSAGGNAFWMLRSPEPMTSKYSNNLCVSGEGIKYSHATDNAKMGVRPAVCVPL